MITYCSTIPAQTVAIKTVTKLPPRRASGLVSSRLNTTSSAPTTIPTATTHSQRFRPEVAST